MIDFAQRWIKRLFLACSIACFAGLSLLEVYYRLLLGENVFGAPVVARMCTWIAVAAGVAGLVLVVRCEAAWEKLFDVPPWRFGSYMLLSVYAGWLYDRHFTALAPDGLDMPLQHIVSIGSFLAFYLFFRFSHNAVTRLFKALFGGGSGLSSHEIMFLGMFTILAGAVMTAMFVLHPVLYDGTGWGVVYTFDSQRHVALDVYAMIDNPENDLRNLFFGFFSAPFTIPCHVLDDAIFVFLQVRIYPFLIGLLQVAAIALSIVLFARMASDGSTGRACVCLLFSSCYAYLLNIFILEQYAFSLFWLAVCVYTHVNDLSEHQAIAGAAAAGCLPSSGLILGLPLLEHESKPGAAKSVIRSVLICVGILLISGKAMRVLASASSLPVMYDGFCASGYSSSSRLEQFLYSIRTVFLQPTVRTAMVPADDGASYMTYLMQEAPDICWIGILILGLSAVSMVLNWHDYFCRFCGWWAFLSGLIVLLFGWGTADNELLIYAMYFGWPYICLLYKLAERVLGHRRHILIGACAMAVGYMAVTNACGLFGMFRFLGQYYSG